MADRKRDQEEVLQIFSNRLSTTLYKMLPRLPDWKGVVVVFLILLVLSWLTALAGFYLHSPPPPRGDGIYLFQTFSSNALQTVISGEQASSNEIHVLHQIANLLRWCALAWLVLAGSFAAFRGTITARLAASIHGHVLVWGSGIAALDTLLANKAAQTPSLALLPQLDTNLQASLDHHSIPWLSPANPDSVLDRTLRCPGATILASDQGDTANIALLERISEKLTKTEPARGTSLIVRISDGRLRGQISDRLIGRPELRKLRVVLYSDDDLRARFAARLTPAFQFCHAKQADVAHLVIVGRGYPAESMLVQLLKTMHFPRGNKLRISVANEVAPTFEADFRSRFPQLADNYPVAFHQLDTSNGADWAGWLLNHVQAGKRPTGWYFVHDDSAAELKNALAVEEAYSIIGEISPPLVLLSAADRESGTSLLKDVPMLKAVGDVTQVEGGDLVSQHRMDAMATAIQQSYLEKCFASGEKLGDRPTLFEWPQLAENFKDENRDQAEHNLIKLLLLGLSSSSDAHSYELDISQDELEILSIAEHDRWLASRRSRNWIYADERDDERRRHPDMVSWADLPEPRREIDRDMVRNLSRLVKRMKLSLKKRIYCRIEAAQALDPSAQSAALQRVRDTLQNQFVSRKPVIVGNPSDPLLEPLLNLLPDAQYLAVIDSPQRLTAQLNHARSVVAEPEDMSPATLSQLLPDLSQDWLAFQIDEEGLVQCEHSKFALEVREAQ